MIARGNERRAIFRDDNDRIGFLELVATVVGERSWRLLAYCLMDNHYHLLVRTEHADLAAGIHYVNGVYAQRFNRRHRRVGHLFQGRYKAILVQQDAHLLGVVRYIVSNPVRARICRHPDQWRWSSHNATLGRTPAGPLSSQVVLALFHPDRARARELYHAFVEDRSEGPPAAHPLIEGDDAYVRDHLALIARSPEHPRSLATPTPPPLDALLTGAPSAAEIAAARAHGHTLAAIAAHLGCDTSTISRRLMRRATTET